MMINATSLIFAALSAPFVLGGTLKIVYDVLLYTTFKDIPLKD